MVSEEIYTQLAQQLGSDNINKVSSLLGIPTQSATIILGVLLAAVFVWSLIWKGLALWKASKKDHKIWFILILIINTIGILEILYIYVFSKMDWTRRVEKKFDKKSKTKKRRR